MKSIKAKIVVLISTILVGFLIATNYNFEGSSSSLNLTAKEYLNSIETKNNLTKEVASLRQINSEIKEKVDQYNNSDVNYVEVVKSMKEQVSDYGRLTGLNEVKGEGIIITINDGVINLAKDNEIVVKEKVLHDIDMAIVLSEIRYAGAEAIAINNHRISLSTATICYGANLKYEDDTTDFAPYNLYIIGNPDALKASLFQQGSHLNRLLFRGLSVEVEVKSEIIMPAAKNIKQMEYASQYIN